MGWAGGLPSLTLASRLPHMSADCSSPPSPSCPGLDWTLSVVPAGTHTALLSAPPAEPPALWLLAGSASGAQQLGG